MNTIRFNKPGIRSEDLKELLSSNLFSEIKTVRFLDRDGITKNKAFNKAYKDVRIGKVIVLGFEAVIDSLTINIKSGLEIDTDMHYDDVSKILGLKKLDLDIKSC